VVWWLAKNLDQVERSVELYPILKRLSEAAQGTLAERPMGEHAAEAEPATAAVNGFGPQIFSSGEYRPAGPLATGLPDFETALEKLLEGCEESERSYIASQLAYLEESFQRPERAARIREHFDVEPVAAESDPLSPVADTGATDAARSTDGARSTHVQHSINGARNTTDEPRSTDGPREQIDGERRSDHYREQFFAD
jgi:hypothetical protein